MRKLYAEKTSSDFIPFFPPVGVSVSEYIAYSSSIDIHTMTVKPSAHYVAIAKNYYEKRKELISEISWPVPGVASITSAFGYRLDPITGRSGTFHTGVDIADANVAGKPVVAFADGAVTYAGWLGGYGLVVIVDHGEGLSTLYAHLSQLFVKNGDNVKTGQLLGAVGSTGRSTGPHLHFEIRINGQPTDPLAHFFVLKPLSQEFREGDRGIDN
ncbi:MAG: M23 family metallopeptidase [Brockia lithotrophica]|nr:M23 family metallopeptidase [Brockia lithotrophica]